MKQGVEIWIEDSDDVVGSLHSSACGTAEKTGMVSAAPLYEFEINVDVKYLFDKYQELLQYIPVVSK